MSAIPGDSIVFDTIIIYNTLLLQEKYAIRVARLGHGAPLGGAEIFILGGVMSVIYLFEKTFLLFPDHPLSAGAEFLYFDEENGGNV